MRVPVVLIFLLLSGCFCAPTKSKDSKYLRLSKLAVNGIVTITDDLYTETFLKGTRDFDAFLLYTTIGKRYHCTLCGAANREFATVAKEYSKLPEKAEKNVLFIRIVIDVSPKVFQYHNIQTAPILTFLAGNELLGKRLNTNNNFQMEYPVRAESIASYARSKIHVLINIHRFPWVQVIILSLFVFGLPLAAYIYLFHYKKVYDWLGNYKIYLVISLLIYAVAVTGFVYDIIHGPPLMNCDAYGCSLFMSQQNQQTVMEGMLTGGFLIGCAYCMTCLMNDSKLDQHSITKYAVILGSCFLAYFLFFCVRTPWYPGVFTYRG